jgi:hypothetical protein
MRISAIDPGFNTGLAIADIELGKNTPYVWLRKYYLGTVEDNAQTVATIVSASRSKIAVMEQKPLHVSTGGKGAGMHDSVAFNLRNCEYEQVSVIFFNSEIDLSTRTHYLTLVGPGIWKPVVKTLQNKSEHLWAAETDHEKDAMGLLLYFATFYLFKNRSVVYGT